MSTLANKQSDDLIATRVTVTQHYLTVEFNDGRVVSLPVSWFPRLACGLQGHRANVEIGPMGLHWPDLDEDLSYEGIIQGRRSGECAKSFRRWLSYYSKGRLPPVKVIPLPPKMAEEMMAEGVDIGEEERQRLVARRRRKAS